MTENNPPRMRQGNEHTLNAEASRAEELKHFFAHFEVNRSAPVLPPPPASNTRTLTLQEQDMRPALRSVNPRKAAGQDGVPNIGMC